MQAKTNKPEGWLKNALEQACREVEESPAWLKAIYAQNEAIERARARQLGIATDVDERNATIKL